MAAAHAADGRVVDRYALGNRLQPSSGPCRRRAQRVRRRRWRFALSMV